MSDDDFYESASAPAGSLKLNIKGEDYLVRVMKPSNSASLNELQLSLQRNREMLKESYAAMHETCRDDFFKRVEKKHVDYFSPTQNALVARANIDLLIPLINVKVALLLIKVSLKACRLKNISPNYAIKQKRIFVKKAQKIESEVFF